jgi:hypothetical protein
VWARCSTNFAAAAALRAALLSAPIAAAHPSLPSPTATHAYSTPPHCQPPTSGTIGKRLEKAGLPSTPESRRAYRELFYTAPGIGAAFSGVIMFKETLQQADSDGTPFVEVLRRQGVLAGIKVDEVGVGVSGLGQRVGAEGGLCCLGLRIAEARYQL